MFELTANLT